MKRLFLLTLLFLFTSASAEILTIWDDVNNMDGTRPNEVIYRINDEIIDPENPPNDWEAITADTIPGYTVTGPLLQDSRVIFIHHHKPKQDLGCVANELQNLSPPTPAEVLTIWDDVDNMDGRRPAEVIYRINDEIIDTDKPPDDWQTIAADTIPGYTVTGPLYHDSRVIFIHHHKPELDLRSVTNELQYSTLRIAMKVTDPGQQEEFRVRLKLGSSGKYKCVTGDTETMIEDGSVLNLHADQVAVITLPIGTQWAIEQDVKVRYKTMVTVDTGESRVDYAASGVAGSSDSTVTYSNIPHMTSFSVTKRWDGAVGERITLHLLANGQPVEAGFFQANNRYTADHLPLYDYDGKPIIYTATEEYLEGYLTAYVNYGMYAGETRFLYDGGTVINREIADFRVFKEWIGIDGEPPEIRLHLFDKDVELPYNPVMQDNWYIWKLPIAYNDRIPEYYVLEEPMRGFMTEYLHNGELADHARNGDTIRNTTVPPTGERHPLLFWLIILVAAGLGVAVVSRRRK